MAGTPFSNPSTVWPFGLITPTVGTPIPITNNIGSQRQAPGVGPGNSKFAQKVTQFIFQTLGNTGLVYILKPGYTKAMTNGIIAILGPNQTQSITVGWGTGGLMPDDFWVDAVTQGDGVYVLGVRGSM